MAKVLADSGVELSRDELLDVLWLAVTLPEDAKPLARAAGVSAVSPERPDTSEHDGASSPPEASKSSGTVSEKMGAENTETGSAHPLLAAGQKPSDQTARTDADATSSPAIGVRTPDSRLAGAGQLRLGKSLRPLRQRFPDRIGHELDVTRTVAAIADTGVPETVTRPVRSRWLSLALVVDDGVSMVLWQRLASEVRKVMERAGAFRDVRVYGLDTRGFAPGLRTGPFRHRGHLQSPKTLCDPAGNTLVLVVSDGVGAAWRDGGMRRVMDLWARCGPTAVVQALPTRLWGSTGLGARQWQVTTHRRGGPTHAWHVTDPDLPPNLVSFDSVAVPILEPTPAAVADWAQLIASPGATALLPLWDDSRPGAEPSIADTDRSNAAEAVMRFREAASPEAYRLAAHVAAVSPVTPPVMRLVQAALPLPTDPGHLMEVFLGGLMHEVDVDQRGRLPHHRRFDFSGDARRILLSAVSPKELLRTAEAVTRRIEAAVGRAPTFPAWVGHPDGAAVIEDSQLSFGWLRDQLLERLGIPSADAQPAVPVAVGRHASGGATEDPAGTGTVGSGGSDPSSEPYMSADDDVRAALGAGWVGLEPGEPARIGRFRLLARCVRGWSHLAMYLGRDEDGAVVAIRVPTPLHIRNPTAALDLVRREAECLLRMRGAHAPALVDVQSHTAEELPWIAATCVHRREGDPSSAPAPTLRGVLHEHGRDVPGELFLRIGLGLSEALARAHSLGIVHGSLAPRTVLVSDSDVRLVGWATATLDGVDSDHREVLPVGEAYVEARDGGPSLTPESDVYAAGAVLLALLAGQWKDPKAGHRDQSPSTTSRIDPALLRILWRCLEHEPTRRPSAAFVAEAFAAAAGGPATAMANQALLARTAEEIRHRRSLARQDMRTHGQRLARLLRKHSNQLALVGQREESVTTAQEGVEVCRELVAVEGRSRFGDLGAALSNLSVRLSEVGRREESLDAVSEAKTLYRDLAQDDFDTFGSGHARILNNQSIHLAEAGRGEQALQAVQKAVEIDRRRTAQGDRASAGDLARSLANLGSRLVDLGREQEAFAAVAEAIDIYRDLHTDHAHQVSRDYAVSLNNHAVLLGNQGRYREALSTVEESVAVQRRYGRDLAHGLTETSEQSERIESWLKDRRTRAPGT